MRQKAFLVLEDGSIFEGISFGATADSYGEVVFNTSMAGYQEILTDPSYAGQIVLPTYPLIGNYGINSEDYESNRIQVRGFIVREECLEPSHYLSKETLDSYLSRSAIPGISGLDTRAITRKLRSTGVMMGMITTGEPNKALEQLKTAPGYDSVDFVREVSTQKLFRSGFDCQICYFRSYCDSSGKICGVERSKSNRPARHIAVLDCGLKLNIIRILLRLGCACTVVPCTTKADAIMALNPDGIFLSPGPGDPELLDYIVNTVKQIIDKKPVMGICLGHQLIARAFGGKTFKLKFGHRGGNHPVRELATGRVHITAQNHGYSVDPDSLKSGLEITHINLNDNTVEGLRHKELPIFAVQYHSEASPGPLDNVYLFKQFLEMIETTN